MRKLFVALYLLLTLTAISQTDTIRLMTYNILNYPYTAPERYTYFETVCHYVLPDMILVNELQSESGADQLLNSALNTSGISYYQRAAFIDGFDTDNMLFYNANKLTLKTQDTIDTGLRVISEYVLYHNAIYNQDTSFFYLYAAHLKAGSYPENVTYRHQEIQRFLQYLQGLPGKQNVILAGDLNLYNSSEPAYDLLINNSQHEFIDPLPAGSWSHNSYYAEWHTQSTREVSFNGGAGGGLDDRFDFILFDYDILNVSESVGYIQNSCLALGNDGNHYNLAINDPVGNPNVPMNVLDALYYMSDHLPVIADFMVSTGPPPEDLVITEIMYNPPESGNDSLEFIELFNPDDVAINTAGYYFSAGVSFDLPAVSIQPNSFMLVCIDSIAFSNTFGTTAYQWTSGALSNGGELIELRNNLGDVVDVVDFDDSNPWPASPDGYGPSLTLCDPSANNALAQNWSSSTVFVMLNAAGDSIFASPGFLDCVQLPVANFAADTTITEPGGTINFHDESSNYPNAWEWTFEGGNPATSTAQNPQGIQYDVPGIYSVSLKVINAAGTDSISKTDYITVLDNSTPQIVITEIMYNPPEWGQDSLEFIEFYNNGAPPVNLKNYSITQGVDYVFPEIILNNGEYFLVSIDSVAFFNTFGIMAYQWNYGALSNSGEDIELRDGADNVLDYINFSDGGAWPSSADGDGPSLTLCNPDDDNSLPENWSASTEFITVNASNDSIFASPGSGCQQSTTKLVDIKVFLEGPFSGGSMDTDLNPGYLPLQQPYNSAPWNYSGTESFAVVPNNTVVDWVLIEFRDAADVSNANPSTTINTQAALVLANGSITSEDGSSMLSLDIEIAQNLFIVIHHRNHLSVISANPAVLNGNVYSFDFTSSVDQVLGGPVGHTELTPGIYGMMAGDANADGQINNTDKNALWSNQAGASGYLEADFNMNSQVDNTDKNDLWIPNSGAGTQVP